MAILPSTQSVPIKGNEDIKGKIKKKNSRRIKWVNWSTAPKNHSLAIYQKSIDRSAEMIR
jgi:hypothetical protein